jgi:choline dehydrogenase-like flavoprotein
VPRSGWPIGPADLAEGYAVAQRLTEIGPEPFDLESWRGVLDAAGVHIVDREDLTTEVFRRSPPTRFGERYRADLEVSETTRVLLRTTAVRIVTAANGRSVRHVQAVTAAGQAVEVTGDAYVLATGGLEVPRLLLVSGIGGDLVGRCFMEHPHLHVAAVAFTSVFEEEVSPLAYGVALPVQGRELLHAFALPTDLVAAERLLGASYSLAHVADGDDPTGPAVAALAADVAGSSVAEPRDLFVRAEQRPHPENRVELDSRATDRFGVPRLRVRWQLRDDDLADHRRALTHVAAALGAAGYGRLRPKRWASGSPPEGLSGGHHHLGTARMSEDPSAGVVDQDLQVHGVAGLHVASSAVFPTGGHANPTLTIVALAARLARHLAATGGG